MPTLAAWTEVWSSLGVNPPPETEFRTLTAAYNEPERAYHTLQHLDECFAQLELVRDRLSQPGAVGVALWYHDAVYDARRSDNETRSADWAAAVARRAGCPAATVGSIRTLILSTAHQHPPLPGDEAYLTDIDLAILGAASERFDEYEAQIRQEYAWVTDPDFRSGRRQVLQRFLDRPTIYATEAFRDRLEPLARLNLARSLARWETA